MHHLGVRESIVDGRRVPGDVAAEDGAVAKVGVLPATRRHVAIPGFVDLEVNGLAGAGFAACHPGGCRVAAAAPAATGATAYQPTFICMPHLCHRPALAVATEGQQSIPAPRLLGHHLEGLSPARIGAHDPADTLPPDPAAAVAIVGAGPVTHTTVGLEPHGIQ